jgi:CubicO group peptidase (beta-lactamase class C family)
LKETESSPVAWAGSATHTSPLSLPGVTLGWSRPAGARAADPPFVEHLGGGAGFFNVIRMYPTREVGIAVMGNATRYDIDAVARLALS